MCGGVELHDLFWLFSDGGRDAERQRREREREKAETRGETELGEDYCTHVVVIGARLGDGMVYVRAECMF